MANIRATTRTVTSSPSARPIGMVTGLFRNRADAERALQAVADRGYSEDDVNVVMSNDTRADFVDSDLDTRDRESLELEGAGAGGAIGTVAGGLLGAIAAIGTNLVIPGLGLVIAGPLAAGLAGAGAGAITGGLIGAIAGWGVPEDYARHYEGGVQEGGVVLGIQPRDEADADYFESEWKKCHAEHVNR
jgi:hypothetical protein